MLISFQLNYWLFYLQWNFLFRGFNQKPDSQCHLNKCIVGFEAKICINLKIRLDHLQAVLAEFSFSIFIHQFAMQSLDHFQIRACSQSDKKEMQSVKTHSPKMLATELQYYFQFIAYFFPSSVIFQRLCNTYLNSTAIQKAFTECKNIFVFLE